jgi:hypothetical protein
VDLYADPAYRETGFRTLADNLHVRHVTGPDGVGCSACHDIHAALRPALIVEWVRRPGSEPQPMQFIRFSTGGTCGPACHETAMYLRAAAAELEKEDP